MAEYNLEAAASLESVPATPINENVSNYTLEMADEALNVVEDWMNWAMFGVGGPA